MEGGRGTGRARDRGGHHFVQRRTQVRGVEPAVAAGAHLARVVCPAVAAGTVRAARARGRAAQRWVPGLERRP